MGPDDITTTTPLAPVWSRDVSLASSLRDFILDPLTYERDHHRGETTPPEWLGYGSPCQAEGWNRNSEIRGLSGDAAVMAGEVRDGHGQPAAFTLAYVQPFRSRAR